VGCNADHGLRRTDADKRRAILRLLNDPEWSTWSDREVARHCRVHHTTVSRTREDIGAFFAGAGRTEKGETRPGREVVFDAAATLNVTGDVASDGVRTYRDRWGNTSTMRTGNIGRRAEPSSPRTLPPITQPAAAPVREQAFAATRADMDENGPIFDAIQAIKREFQTLPAPDEAARRFPRPLRHTFSPAQAQHLADWFSEFGRAWATENGEAHVIAAE
jgi:hypothetical protein